MEVSGPPQFLNSSVQEEAVKDDGQRWRHGGRRNRKEKKDVPSGNFSFSFISTIAPVQVFCHLLHLLLIDGVGSSFYIAFVE